jgi:Cellulase (glycosyl hydrolase family 5)
MRMRSFIKVIFSISLLTSAWSYGFDDVTLDDKSALFTVSDKSLPIITAKYIGWGANWTWAGAKIKPDNPLGNNKSVGAAYIGSIPKLDIDFFSKARLNKNQIIWTYDWNKKISHPDAVGFGIEFNLQLESPSFESKSQEPELLSGNQGWRWQAPGGQSIEVKFSPALAKLYFEHKQKNKIRAMFFASVKDGTEQSTMTVTMTGKNFRVSELVSLNLDEVDARKWHKDILSDGVSPVDFSFLNAKDLPAGKHGFVKAQADQLVFSDGTPTKFWGVNLMASAVFGTAEDEIKVHAKRIAQLGFNLIRFHHHDSRWVSPNIFRNQADNTQEYSEESFKKLDFWIKCLKDEGVYVWLDLHVGREFTKNDGIDNLDEMAKGKVKKGKNKGEDKDWAEVKGFNYYNESIQKQMQKFNEAYLNHINSFTGLAYKDDPAVIALLISNENDLTQHFGNALLPNKGVPVHNAIFTNDAKKFSDISGLSNKKVWRAWEMGEPKIYLSDVEHRFNQKMIAHLRGLGARSMIATTNSWGKMGLFGLASLTDGNLIDAHSYGHSEEFNFNPRYNPGFLTWIGAAQVTGKPLSVTEWNIVPFPAADRFTAPIFTAAIANLQSWDAMMLYGYSQAKLGNIKNGSNFSSFNDPAIMGLMPAAALLYRQNHVSAAKQNYELKLSGEDFFYKKQDPTTSKTIRTLLETSRFSVTVPEVKELPWLKANIKPANNATVVSDANKDFIPQGQEFVQSDTGELKRDWSKGIHTINTPKSQIASGWIGGETLSLQGAEFKIKTKKAVVAVQSTDNKPIKDSKSIFITVMARSMPETGNKLPFLSEPVIGEIVVSAPSGLKLFPINRLGERERPLNVSYAKGKYTVKLDEKNEAHWFMLSAN